MIINDKSFWTLAGSSESVFKSGEMLGHTHPWPLQQHSIHLHQRKVCGYFYWDGLTARGGLPCRTFCQIPESHEQGRTGRRIINANTRNVKALASRIRMHVTQCSRYTQQNWSRADVGQIILGRSCFQVRPSWHALLSFHFTMSFPSNINTAHTVQYYSKFIFKSCNSFLPTNKIFFKPHFLKFCRNNQMLNKWWNKTFMHLCVLLIFQQTLDWNTCRNAGNKMGSLNVFCHTWTIWLALIICVTLTYRHIHFWLLEGHKLGLNVIFEYIKVLLSKTFGSAPSLFET